MGRLRGFGAFWWDFIVGDDWRIAVGVVVALALTAALSDGGITAWWVVPVLVLGMLATSVLGVWRSQRRT
jgi:hypothetical protein